MKGLEAEAVLAVVNEVYIFFSHRMQYLQAVRLLSVSRSLMKCRQEKVP